MNAAPSQPFALHSYGVSLRAPKLQKVSEIGHAFDVILRRALEARRVIALVSGYSHMRTYGEHLTGWEVRLIALLWAERG